MIKVDLILCGIIATDMGLDPNRVVVYNQNWKSPQDDGIYIIISEGPSRIIGNTNRFKPADPEAVPPTVDREVKCVSTSTTYNIEITSRNTDAKYRKAEILAAIGSNYSEQQQELNQIRIFRTIQILDLSFIDGRSSLHRYQIPVIINSVQTYEKPLVTYNKFQSTEPGIFPEPEVSPHSIIEKFSFWKYASEPVPTLTTEGFIRYIDSPFGEFLRY